MEGLFLDKYLGFQLGVDMSSFVFADTLVGRMLPDGGISGVRVDVPGFRKRIDSAGETLAYLHPGVYAHYYLTQKLSNSDSVFKKK